MHITVSSSVTIDSAIAWFYVGTNALRVFTYLPQISAVWKSRDGARAVSLITWSSWLLANFAGVLYGVALQDAFFTLMSLMNFAGCAAVTGLALHRRRAFRFVERVASQGPVGWPTVASPRLRGAYLEAAMVPRHTRSLHRQT